MSSKFMQTFKENILTLQLIHSNIILKLIYKAEKSVPSSYINYIENELNKYKLYIYKTPKQDLSKLFGKNILKDISISYKPQQYFILNTELNSFFKSKISNKDFIIYICRNAINFTFTEIENYFFKCFKKIYMKYPRKIEDKRLKLKKLIDQEFNGHRLLELAADKVAEKIHKTPIKDILYEAEKDHGINHQIKQEDIQKLETLKQIRNLFTHGDGTITQRYLKKVKHSNYTIGEKFRLDFEVINYYINLALEILTRFDKALIKKYPDFKTK